MTCLGLDKNQIFNCALPHVARNLAVSPVLLKLGFEVSKSREGRDDFQVRRKEVGVWEVNALHQKTNVYCGQSCF